MAAVCVTLESVNAIPGTVGLLVSAWTVPVVPGGVRGGEFVIWECVDVVQGIRGKIVAWSNP